MLILTIIEGPDAGKRFELPANEPQLLGRSSEALPISDNTVSRRHAELTPDAGEWWIRDLESQNGTWINGVRIDERVRLRRGDLVRVGSSLFAFGTVDPTKTNAVSIVADGILETEFEHTLASEDDSVILAEPEPGAAAVHHLKVVYHLTTLLGHTTDRRTLLSSVMDLVFREFSPERGFIMVRGAGVDTTLEPAVVRYKLPPRDESEARIHVSRTILRHCVTKGEGILCTNAMNDPRFQAGDSVQRFKIRSAICAPIRHRDRVYGAIYIDSSIINFSFTREQLALLNAIGQHTGLALANAELGAQKINAERLAAMGETVASLSHSIKNILQGLRGGADLVQIGLDREDLDVARDGWTIQKRNIDRIVSLTVNMLTFSRQKQVEIELTPLKKLIEECAELLGPVCEEKGCAMILDPDPEMPPIAVDPNLMHQAIMNLMGNAVDAVDSSGGVVTVRTMYHTPDPLLQSQPPMAEIQVRDNGQGIPEDKLRWIFEPFNTTKGTRGTGLGLAVTKRIIEDHRGHVEVRSEVSGTTFRVILPADQHGELDPAATAESKAAESDPLGNA